MMPAKHTIKSLALSPEEARNGKTWKLLPPGFRAQEHGSTWPMPARTRELGLIAKIQVPEHKTDSGCVYIRRCRRELERRHMLAADRARELRLKAMTPEERLQVDEEYARTLDKAVHDATRRINQEVDGIREVCEKAAASLDELFELGRRGVEGQMRAHLEGDDWQEEKISAAAFRDCFKMVTGAVTKMGVPTGQEKKARDAIFHEISAAEDDLKESLALQKAETTVPEAETEH